jgi:hypothetical protein
MTKPTARALNFQFWAHSCNLAEGRREAIEELYILWRWADSQGMVGDQMARAESFLARALADPAEAK